MYERSFLLGIFFDVVLERQFKALPFLEKNLIWVSIPVIFVGAVMGADRLRRRTAARSLVGLG
jgi:hypothetical protein